VAKQYLFFVGKLREQPPFDGGHFFTEVLHGLLPLWGSNDKPLSTIVWVRPTLYEAGFYQVVKQICHDSAIYP
jgi:hypothetical protein